MRLLLDENVSMTVTALLKQSGHQADHVYDLGLAAASDDEVLAVAKRKRAVVVTHDKDFGNLIRYSRGDHYGVILLRFKNQAPQLVGPSLVKFLTGRKTLKSRLVVLREEGYRMV